MKRIAWLLIALTLVVFVAGRSVAASGTITVYIYNDTDSYINAHLINRTTKSAAWGRCAPRSWTTVVTDSRSLSKPTDIQLGCFVTDSNFEGLGAFVNCYFK